MRAALKRLAGWVLSGVVLIPAGGAAQGGPTPPPGRPSLFVLNLADTPLDEFPGLVKALSGVMTVVDKDGQHMLKASSPSEFLIMLPQALPAEFTVQLDFIPKACCAPDDITLEGTPTRNRGVASAELTWQPERISAVGGSPDMYQSAMPADLAASTPGSLTHLVVVFQGSTIKLYTNGRRLYSLEKQFVRGRVLRVGLGGADDDQNAVYLAGLSIYGGAVSLTTIAGNPPSTETSSQAQRANTTPSSGGGGTGGSGVTAVGGSGTSPATLAPAPAPVTAVPAAPTTGTITPSALPPAVSSPREITPAISSGPLSGRSGSSGSGSTTGLPARTLTLAGFSATGGSVSLAARTITLSGFSATGGSSTLAPRTIALAGFSAAGPSNSVLAPRQIDLAGFTASGLSTSLASRTVEPGAFAGTGLFSSLAPRTLSLGGFTAAGTFVALPSRAITLDGFIAAGLFTTLPSRTIALGGWTVVGTNP